MGCSISQVLEKVVKQMARTYTGIDARNREERVKLYMEKFKTQHKNQRHIVQNAKHAAAAASAQLTAGQATQHAAGGSGAGGCSRADPRLSSQRAVRMTFLL